MKLISKKDTCVMNNAEVRKLKRKAELYDEMHKVIKGMDDIYLDPKFDNWLKFYYELYTPGVAVIKSLQSFARELRAELNSPIAGDNLKGQYECTVKGDNNLIETTISLNKENADLSEEIIAMNEKLWKRDEEIEQLKKELEYQELLNRKLTDANVKQVETIKQRNAEVGVLKQMIHTYGNK
ncbi:hypothetical protein [Ligilactobacillus animalis]|uniref:hypothetical protein n=1 Tax=Ligilactobacillus animalis TaxID=1605 RepID=UPI0026DECDF3|nr:hypothetical protein [Ligilactobacillus animalis]MDO5884190.1 hypothetical protein [Ligilactobacillus animalis]